MDYGTQNWVLQEESQNVECTCITGRDRTCYVPSSSPSEKTPTISQSKNIWSSKNLKWQPQHRWPHLLVTPIDLWGRNKASKSDVDSNRCAVKNPIALSQWWPHHCVVHTTLLLSLVQPLRIFYLLCYMCEVFFKKVWQKYNLWKQKKWIINSFNDLNYIVVKQSTNHLANSAEWRKKYVIRLNTYGQSCSVVVLYNLFFYFYFWSNANSNMNHV